MTSFIPNLPKEIFTGTSLSRTRINSDRFTRFKPILSRTLASINTPGPPTPFPPLDFSSKPPGRPWGSSPHHHCRRHLRNFPVRTFVHCPPLPFHTSSPLMAHKLMNFVFLIRARSTGAAHRNLAAAEPVPATRRRRRRNLEAAATPPSSSPSSPQQSGNRATH